MSRGEALSAIFAQHAGIAARALLALPDLDARLAAVHQEAAAAHPTFAVPVEAFVAHLAARAFASPVQMPDADAAAVRGGEGEKGEAEATFARAVAHAGDLYLAAGVVRGSA